MRTPEECGRAVMKVFVELTERPYPVEEGWAVRQLSRGVLKQKIGDEEDVDRGVDFALERLWIIEKAPGTDMYCPTETGFEECWDS